MTKITTVIIDDEPKNIRVLKNLLTEFCPQVQLTGEANDARSGKELILQQQPQLVFLDIEMPYGNGFDLLNELMPVNFEVVFVTAFDKYMMQAFKYSALDFLLKPVNIEELKTAVANAEARIGKSQSSSQVSVLMENIQKPSANLHKIALPTAYGLEFVKISDIIRCEAKGAYTEIHIHNSTKRMVTKTLGEYEELLPEDIFFRLHHSHLVNLNYIKKYHKGRGGVVELEDGMSIEVAARRKAEFFKRIGAG
jgi:two-component system, LytTR family, response regulator